MRRKRQTGEQLELDLRPRTWGGARAGAGRPRTSGRVAHARRPEHVARFPLHVTLRARRDLPTLRQPSVFLAIAATLKRASTDDFRVVEVSVQRDHVHLIAEASDKASLARGARSVTVRLAAAINRAFGREGRVFVDRYHARPLTTPLEVRRALVYVLANHAKHGEATTSPVAGPSSHAVALDPFSSARWFIGWTPSATPARDRLLSLRAVELRPVAPAATWLARTGWRRHGLLDPSESPRPHRPHRRRE